MPPLPVVPSLSQPARHELCPCCVRPIAAAIDKSAFKCLTIPAIRAPCGMNFVHTSRDYPLQELSKLLSLVLKHSNKFGVSLAYSQHCGRVGHRHFFRESFKKLRLSFLYVILSVAKNLFFNAVNPPYQLWAAGTVYVVGE